MHFIDTSSTICSKDLLVFSHLVFHIFDSFSNFRIVFVIYNETKMYKISTNDTDELQRMNHQLINKGTHAKLGVYSCLLKRFISVQQAVVE